mmetsp:Transcript_85253/g.170600  ORF Transcript_85253/g.170600 Transcript_85253/m.170600 type:complete len:333 (-) Transcript_85253:2-1000(-)
MPRALSCEHERLALLLPLLSAAPPAAELLVLTENSTAATAVARGFTRGGRNVVRSRFGLFRESSDHLRVAFQRRHVARPRLDLAALPLPRRRAAAVQAHFDPPFVDHGGHHAHSLLGGHSLVEQAEGPVLGHARVPRTMGGQREGKPRRSRDNPRNLVVADVFPFSTFCFAVGFTVHRCAPNVGAQTRTTKASTVAALRHTAATTSACRSTRGRRRACLGGGGGGVVPKPGKAHAVRAPRLGLHHHPPFPARLGHDPGPARGAHRPPHHASSLAALQARSAAPRELRVEEPAEFAPPLPRTGQSSGCKELGATPLLNSFCCRGRRRFRFCRR